MNTHSNRPAWGFAFLAGALLTGCLSQQAAVTPTQTAATPAPAIALQDAKAYRWELPQGFPTPLVPEDNPMSEAKVQLGRKLFYDKRLSGNQTYSCASCHDQAKAFSDGRPQALGSTNETHPRGSIALMNLAYTSALAWSNPTVKNLEQQALVPMFGAHPVELGLEGMENTLVARLKADASYPKEFAASFPGTSDAVTVQNITRAISAFERTMLSGDSAYDRFQRGDKNAMSDSAKRGLEMFFSERFECYHCHGGFNFSDSVRYEKGPNETPLYRNTGLYNLGGNGAYPEGGTGVFEISERKEDMGKFKVPTLRNIALSAPYMHDGSIATLEEVIDHYAAGGRTIASGPKAGVGSKNPYKDTLIRGFDLDAQEKADMVAFLKALTDENFVKDPRFSDPFKK